MYVGICIYGYLNFFQNTYYPLFKMWNYMESFLALPEIYTPGTWLALPSTLYPMFPFINSHRVSFILRKVSCCFIPQLFVSPLYLIIIK